MIIFSYISVMTSKANNIITALYWILAKTGDFGFNPDVTNWHTNPYVGSFYCSLVILADEVLSSITMDQVGC